MGNLMPRNKLYMGTLMSRNKICMGNCKIQVLKTTYSAFVLGVKLMLASYILWIKACM